ncbi:MAG TPA: hypothetical protein VM118_13650, partial [Acidobacteriota bacterium]|nr:hypothetical protein [Acidobacteriota bacterium]
MKLFTRLVLFSFLLVTAAIRPAIAESPEAIQEQRAIGAVTAIQAGDVDALLAYMNANWVPAKEGDDRASRWNQIARTLTERHAGLEILGVEITEPYRLTIVAEDPEGVTLSFGFEFETQSPYRVLGMSIEAGDRGGRSGIELPPFELPPDADENTIIATLTTW